MEVKRKNGSTIAFESVEEREARYKKVALTMFEVCKSEHLTISEFNRTIEILDTLVIQQTHM